MRLREVFNNNFRCCGYHNVKAEHKRAEVGYEIGQKYWGQGIMQEVMQAVLHTALIPWDLRFDN